MSLTRHLGYGPFRLFQFLPGEIFARYDGALAQVCDPQPAGRPDYVQVWTNHGTSNAERQWLHRNALAYAVSEEQGWAIERRRNGGGA
jgi:hypothetical protein